MCECPNITHACKMSDLQTLEKIANFGGCFKDPSGDIKPPCCNDLLNDLCSCKNDNKVCNEDEIRDLENRTSLLQCGNAPCEEEQQDEQIDEEKILKVGDRSKRYAAVEQDYGPPPPGYGPGQGPGPGPGPGPYAVNQEDWMQEPPPAVVEKEWEFIDEYMSLSGNMRKKIGHSFQDFVQSCIFRGKNCTNETYVTFIFEMHLISQK